MPLTRSATNDDPPPPPTRSPSESLSPSSENSSSILLSSQSSMAAKLSMSGSRLECFRSIQLLRRIAGPLALLPHAPPITTQASNIEWKFNFIASDYEEFNHLYEMQFNRITEYRRSIMASGNPTEPLTSRDLSLWILTLAYGIYLSVSDYSFWAERLQLVTNAEWMMRLVQGDEEDSGPREESEDQGQVSNDRQTPKTSCGTHQQTKTFHGADSTHTYTHTNNNSSNNNNNNHYNNSNNDNDKHHHASVGRSGGLPHKLPPLSCLIRVVQHEKHSPKGIQHPKVDHTPYDALNDEGKECSEKDWTTTEEEEEGDLVEEVHLQDEHNDEDFLQQQYSYLLRYWLPKVTDIIAVSSLTYSAFTPCTTNGRIVENEELSTPGTIEKTATISTLANPSTSFIPQSASMDPKLVAQPSASALKTQPPSSSFFHSHSHLPQPPHPQRQQRHHHHHEKRRYSLAVAYSLTSFSIWRSIKWELDTTRAILIKYPKNFQVWNHRLLLLRTAVEQTKDEMIAFVKEEGELQRQRSSGAGLSPTLSSVPHAGASSSPSHSSYETQKNWNAYFHAYHHPLLHFENDFDDRGLITAVLFENNAKNYHTWLYRHDFLQLFPFLLQIPTLREMQNFLGLLGHQSTPGLKSEQTHSTTESAETQKYSVELLPSTCRLREEFDCCDFFIQDDVMNNSAWSHRFNMFHYYILLPLLQEFKDTLIASLADDASNEARPISPSEFSLMRRTAFELCKREMTYAMQQYERDLSNECPLTHARCVAQLFQAFDSRLGFARRLYDSTPSSSKINEEPAFGTHTFMFNFLIRKRLEVVLGRLDWLNVTRSRAEMQRLVKQLEQQQQQQMKENTPTSESYRVANDDMEREEESTSAENVLRSSCDLTWDGPTHFFLSIVFSWEEYLQTFDLVFLLFHTLTNSFVPQVEKAQREWCSLLERGTPEALQAIRDKYPVQMQMDHLDFQCDATRYHLLYFFLEQTWQLYFESMQSGGPPNSSHTTPTEDGKPEIPATEMAEGKGIGPEDHNNAFQPQRDIHLYRPSTVYARDGVTSDMLYAKDEADKMTVEKTGENTFFEKGLFSIEGGEGNSEDVLREHEKEAQVRQSVPRMSQTSYQNMIKFYLRQEAHALLLAKKLTIEDPIRQKYWRNEVKEVLFRHYGE